jgi:DNA polymerase-3 subunit delta'
MQGIALHPREHNRFYGCEEAAFRLSAMTDAMPNAVLLYGERGTGKATLAYRLARKYLGAKTPGAPEDGSPFLSFSMSDPVCMRIAASSHADLKTVEPSKEGASETISVDAVRALAKFIGLTSSESGRKCVLIDDADRMNRNAQNALLKMLEEPTGNACFLLVCHHISALLPTVVSRCRKFLLLPPDAASCEQALRPLFPDKSPESLRAAAALAGGCPGRAGAFLNADLGEDASAVLRILDALKRGRDADAASLFDKLAAGGAAAEKWPHVMYLLAFLLSLLARSGEAGDGALPDEESRALLRSLRARLSLREKEALRQRYADAARHAEALHLDKGVALKSVLWAAC